MVEKRLKKVEKRLKNSTFLVENKAGMQPKMTKTEAVVLSLFVDDYLTPKQIAIRRQTTDKAVYKILKNLRKKGLISIANKKVEKSRGTFQPFSTKMSTHSHLIRLHGQEYHVRILYKDKRYEKIRKSCNLIQIGESTIKLYDRAIEIYIKRSFEAEDVNKATADSLKYLDRLLARLENDCKIILVKPRNQNIKLVNQHYAEINNELSQHCHNTAQKIRIYTNDDGKLWFIIDNSLNLHEAETSHPDTAKRDMGETVKPFFNDLRDNNPPKPSEQWKIISALAYYTKETAAGLAGLTKLLTPQTAKKEPDKDQEAEYIG